MKDEIILEIKGLNKTFGPTHANNNIDLTLRKGEIRGLAGENGCGKSTLMSILAGMQEKDSGSMYLNGELYEPENLLHSNARGIGMVVQELGLLEQLPGYFNMYFGRMKEFSSFGVINIKKLKRKANDELRKWGLEYVSIDKFASQLSYEDRKIIELTRALSIDPQIIILDELTQALSHNSRKILYDVVKKFREQGKSAFVISHDLEELLEITDTVTIMRDGEIVETCASSELTENDLRYKMIGRNLEGDYFRSDNGAVYSNEVVLTAEDICVGNCVKHVSFELHKGEILAFCGLSDAGTHTIGQALFGVQPLSGGRVYLNKRKKEIRNPVEAAKSGIGYVPKDRDIEGMMLGDTIRENLCLPSVSEIKKRFSLLHPSDLSNYAQKAVDNFEIKCTGVGQIANSLSGGNKQKINLGRWMSKDLEILLLDSPTRGVDVGVKAYIYQTMVKAKEAGISMILFSDELPEALGMADRILVMKDGDITAEFMRGKDFSEESIIEVMI